MVLCLLIIYEYIVTDFLLIRLICIATNKVNLSVNSVLHTCRMMQGAVKVFGGPDLKWF